MATDNKVVIVNEKDEVIGAMDMMQAHQEGRLRRAARVFVLNEKGQVLLQRRSESVLHPLLLDQSVGGHVDEGESYHEAAKREMAEELGIDAVPLEEVVTSYRTEYHFNAIYRTRIHSQDEVSFDPDEVAGVTWYDPDELSVKVEQSPEEFTSSFPQVWRELRDKIITP